MRIFLLRHSVRVRLDRCAIVQERALSAVTENLVVDCFLPAVELRCA
jgi:hypothetical protein